MAYTVMTGVRGFPMGLGGLYARAVSDDLEERVTSVQEDVKDTAENHSDLWCQAMYQFLYGRGHRVPPDMHNELRKLAKKEKQV